MPPTVTPITLGSGALSVNCYLIAADAGFVLVDTGVRNQRTKLEEHLSAAGCKRGSLNLILITHGDFDHIGNAAYLREQFDAAIAINAGDTGMAAEGDMFSGRKPPKAVLKTLLPLLVRLPNADRFDPDVLLDEHSSLAEYGLPDARILLLQGHSAGSIAVVLGDGSLICGDVLENRSVPKLGAIMDDVPTAEASVERLRTMSIGTVYPGHGRPFEMSKLAAG